LTKTAWRWPSRTAESSVRCCRARACVRCTTPIGGVFETESEIIDLLDTLGPDVIGFGPDTGHLVWAGADPVALIHRYADRVGGIHLKDCFPDYLDPATREGLDYHQIGATRRLWAEPGRGVVDLDAIVAALPADYDGDYMIEVDVPSAESRFESQPALVRMGRTGTELSGRLIFGSPDLLLGRGGSRTAR
jgi:sugar phosphate isomerase/epimerase